MPLKVWHRALRRCAMPNRMKDTKVLMEVPAEFEDTIGRLLKLKERNERMARGEEPVDWRSVSAELEAVMREGEAQVTRRMLQSYDERARVIEVDGKKYRRVGRYEGTYYTKAGPVTVMRTLYRDAAVRNDKTVDAISLKLGCVEDGWLPEAADAMGHLLQAMPGAEAERLAKKLGRVPYSASSFKRIGVAVGELYEAQRDEVENALIEETVIPDKARSLTISLDRVSVPVEEPRKRKVGRPKRGEAKNPVARVYRMAWVGTVTLNDANGEALHTIRYGRMPVKEPTELLDSMQGDVLALLAKRPDLKVSVLCDGASEVVDRLDAYFSAEKLGVPVVRLVDFWHVIEKLGKAAALIYGADGPARLEQWKVRLLNSRHARRQILEELRQSGLEWKPLGDAGEVQPVHEAMTYLTNQADRMDYSAARAAGLPIGSGNVEATCKSLVALRMKRPGARWKPEGGQAVLNLRALALSDRWDRAMQLTLAPLRHEVRPAA